MYFFFCKQKTAYEMRISDWSSDVCSSDLAVVASSTDAIISKSLNGIVQSWNAGAEQIFGYKAEEMIGQPIIRIIPAELRQEEEEILSKLRRGERIRSEEHTSELQSLMRSSYAVFCLKKKKKKNTKNNAQIE